MYEFFLENVPKDGKTSFFSFCGDTGDIVLFENMLGRKRKT